MHISAVSVWLAIPSPLIHWNWSHQSGRHSLLLTGLCKQSKWTCLRHLHTHMSFFLSQSEHVSVIFILICLSKAAALKKTSQTHLVARKLVETSADHLQSSFPWGSFLEFCALLLLMVSLFVETLELKEERSKARLCPFLFCIEACMQFFHLSLKP